MKKTKVVQISLCVSVVPTVFVFFVVPILIYLFPQIMLHLFFLNFRKIPMTDYENVSSNNVNSIGKSFYLQGDQGKLGIWHILPQTLSESYRKKHIVPTDQEIEDSLGMEKYPVILYAHGNSFDRTIDHRCQLYNVLTAMDCQVIAFDYRGYGDSEGSPTEEGIVNDTRIVFEYLRPRVADNLLFVWGHSMGTGVATKLVKDLSDEGRAPHGLILESPFNNLHDAIMNHPFSLLLRWMPDFVFNTFILNPLRSVGLIMDSDKRIADIVCPILILHAEDDHVIPVKLGRGLRDAALKSGRDVEYVEFGNMRQFKHKLIYLAEELPFLIRSFFKKCDSARK